MTRVQPAPPKLRETRMAWMLVAVGAPLRQLMTYLGGLSRLSLSALRLAGAPPYDPRAIVQQMDRIGAQSLPIALLTALFVGMVFALESSYGLQKFGAHTLMGVAVALAIVRELGPVMTAIMVGGRVGAGMTAELGAMRVTEQIDAMRALGADPVQMLVTPRLLATLVVLPLLTILADVVGIAGGMLIAGLELRMGSRQFLAIVLQTLTVGDVVSGLAKALCFGGVIASVACYHGLHAGGGTEGVGQATTATVVVMALLILIADFFLSKLFLLVFPPWVSL
jgi:phospholipid/cholesterol/gamma-HCH transport system permease protein